MVAIVQVIKPVKVVLQDFYQQTVTTASGWLCEVSAAGAGISSLSGGKAITANGTATFQDLIVAGAPVPLTPTPLDRATYISCIADDSSSLHACQAL